MNESTTDRGQRSEGLNPTFSSLAVQTEKCTKCFEERLAVLDIRQRRLDFYHYMTMDTWERTETDLLS
jgi:hypothetical protein